MRPHRKPPGRAFLPRPLRQEHRNQPEEQPRHLQPHHARKPRQRRPHRPPQLPCMLLRRRHGPLRLRHLLRHAINGRGRLPRLRRRLPRLRRRLSPRRRPRRPRRRRRVRRLHQRLRRMPSAIPQRASKPYPVHSLSSLPPARPLTPSPSPASNPSRRSKSQSKQKPKGQA